MLPRPSDLQRYARNESRRLAVLAAGWLFVATGTGFLLAAVWMLVAEQFGPVAASFALTGLTAGLGILIVLMAPRQQDMIKPPTERRRRPAERQNLFRPDGDMPPLVQALLFGISIALDVRARQRRG